MVKIILMLVLLVASVMVETKEKGCLLSFTEENAAYFPILVNDSYLLMTEEGKIKLRTGQTIDLACTGKRNFNQATHNAQEKATCRMDDLLEINNALYRFDRLICSKASLATAHFTNTKCGKRKGNIIKVGYNVSESFLDLFAICFNKAKEVAYYSEHILEGRELQFASKYMDRPSFSTMEVDKSVDSAYKIAFEKRTFARLLGKNSTYITESSYLARGHLSPVKDFILATWQQATFFYINVVPQWQQINNANWKKLENLLRNFAQSTKESYFIYTGTYQTLKINKKTIYLEPNNKLPTPKFIWKIIYSKRSKKGIGFVVMNNPFEIVNDSDFFCENICKQFGWDRDPSFSNYEKGYLICCDVNDLLEKVQTGPSNIHSQGVLSYVNKLPFKAGLPVNLK